MTVGFKADTSVKNHNSIRVTFDAGPISNHLICLKMLTCVTLTDTTQILVPAHTTFVPVMFFSKKFLIIEDCKCSPGN